MIEDIAFKATKTLKINNKTDYYTKAIAQNTDDSVELLLK